MKQRDPTLELIVVNGLLWTGSGAVCDLLFDHEGVGRINRHSYTAETAFSKGKYSLAAMYSRLRDGVCIDASRIPYLQSLLLGVPGGPEGGPPIEELHVTRNALVAQALGEPYLDLVAKLAVDLTAASALATAGAQITVFGSAIATFYRALAELIPGDQFLSNRRYLILNNDPNGGTLHFAACVPASSIFLVVRNPADTFANMVLRKYCEGNKRAADAYVNMLRKRIGILMETCERKEFGGGILKAVIFDELVTQPEKFEPLILRGLDLGERKGTRWDPSVSVKKVGIAAGLPADVRQRIEFRTRKLWPRLVEFLYDTGIKIDA